jgi:hypothetical protein
LAGPCRRFRGACPGFFPFAGDYVAQDGVVSTRNTPLYTTLPGPKRTYLFDDLTATTVDVLYKVKCAIIHTALFLWSTENHKCGDQPTAEARLSTDQHLDT